MKTIGITRAFAVALIGASLAGAPTRAVGQVTTVTGRVTTEAGVGIGGVYVGALGAIIGQPKPNNEVDVERAETRTSANGTYSLKIPFRPGNNGRYHELRVGMPGYEPQTHTVLVGATVEENFRLKVDTYVAKATDVAAAAGSAKFSGKVTNDAGAGIDSAQVYINDLNLVVLTNSAGEYSFDAPARGSLVNLRARKLGYAPGVQIVRLVAGTQTTSFKLAGDGIVRTEVPVRAKMPQGGLGAEPARASYQVVPGMRVAQAQGGSAVPIQADPFGRYLFTADQVMQYQDAIGLQEAQRVELQRAVETAQSQTVKMQWALALETEKLSKMLAEDKLDEKEVLGQTDRIMALEREIKRAQMTLMIKIKNTLTFEQQTKLRQLR